MAASDRAYELSEDETSPLEYLATKRQRRAASSAGRAFAPSTELELSKGRLFSGRSSDMVQPLSTTGIFRAQTKTMDHDRRSGSLKQIDSRFDECFPFSSSRSSSSVASVPSLPQHGPFSNVTIAPDLGHSSARTSGPRPPNPRLTQVPARPPYPSAASYPPSLPPTSMPSFLSSDALAPLRNLRHQVYANPSKKRASVTVSPKSTVPACSTADLASTSAASSVAGPSSHAGPSVQTIVGGGGVTKRTSPTKQSSTRRTPSETFVAEVKRRRDEKAQMKLGVGSVGMAGPQECRMLFEDEYREDVVCYMREQETSTRSQVDLMDMQPELQWYMRPYLVEFLVEIHQQFRLRPEVLYLSLNIVDRYVSKRVVFKKHYQLVGCAALWIAAKYEDSKDKVPTVEMLRDMCCAAYDESAFLQMEGHVLSTIGWNLSHPTAESWLRLSCMGTSKEDAETQHVARFVMELTLFHKEFVAFLPSAIAGGALLLARHLLNKPRRQLDEYDTAVDVAFRIDAHLGQQLELVSEIVVAKYSHGYYNRASHFVRQEYLKGRRFEIRVPAPLTVNIPKRASRSVSGVPSLVPSWLSRSNSSSSVSSDFSSPRRSGSAYSSDSEMPDTPTWNTATSDPFLVVSASNSASSLSSMRGIPSVVEPVKPAAVAVKLPIAIAEKENANNGYVVQEPRAVFSSLNQKVGVNQAVMRPAQSYATLPVPVAMSRRFSQ